MTQNELVERYLHAIAQQLPAKQRDDIITELRSLLEDALESRYGKEATPAETASLLLEWGPPQTVAAQYRTPEYLIGPQLLPIYRTIVAVGLLLLAFVQAGIFAGTLLEADAPLTLSNVWAQLFNYFEMALFHFGGVTLIFMGIERFAADDLPEVDDAQAWEPFDLPPVNDRNRVNRAEIGFELLVTILAVSVILVPLRPMATLDGFLTDTARAWLPWLLMPFLAEVVLKLVVAWLGRWQPLTRWMEVGLEVASIGLLIGLLFAGPLTTVAVFNDGIRVGIMIVALALTVNLVWMLWRLLRTSMRSQTVAMGVVGS